MVTKKEKKELVAFIDDLIYKCHIALLANNNPIYHYGEITILEKVRAKVWRMKLTKG